MSLSDVSVLFYGQQQDEITTTILNNDTVVNLNDLSKPYDNWDANSIQMCNCDMSYFGPSCALSK